MVTIAGALFLVLGTACAPEGSSGNGGAPPGAVAHAFRGTYEVPVTPDLASAAVYGVAEVEWHVVGNTVTLEYDLPLGLVGTDVRVEFTGPMDTATSTAKLTGLPGTADCTLSGTGISCLEHMSGLLPMTPDYAVIEALAQTEYAGPAAHRIEVAKQFAVDPIGIVKFDLDAPVVGDDSIDDDHGIEHD
ncbi:Hypothetical protein A7982_06858 [Minicystis rosea]|nr:Hypothetical protein A7982_06858 [Minicystis rosea]